MNDHANRVTFGQTPIEARSGEETPTVGRLVDLLLGMATDVLGEVEEVMSWFNEFRSSRRS